MLFRVSLVALGVALALAGCQGATPIEEREPDTAPEFSGSVANQTYKALQDIEALTLPSATGGNGDLRYSLDPGPAPRAQLQQRHAQAVRNAVSDRQQRKRPSTE